MTKLIPLTKGQFAIVDDEDYDWLMQWKWSYLDDKVGYAIRSVWANGRSKLIPMHRVILNAPDGMQVDHIDLNGLNNTRANLRLATHAEQQRNRGPQRRNNRTSGYKGVYRHGNRWFASIHVNGQRIRPPSFATEVEAAHVYDNLARQHFGSFAYLNFPEE